MMDPLKRIQSLRKPSRCLVPEHGRTVPVSPELIQECLGWRAMDDERPLRQTRIAYLFHAVQSVGLPFQWHCARVRNTVFRLNGQHSLQLLHERPNLIRDGMLANIVEYKCIDDIEMRTIWAAYDARPMVRTLPEINTAFRGGHEQLEKLPPSFVTLCASGIRISLIGNNKNSRPMSCVDHAELLYSSVDFILAAHAVIPVKSDATIHMWRAPVLFAMHRTFSVNPDDFLKFWTLVRDGDPDRGSIPDLTRDYLIRTALGGTTSMSNRADSRNTMCEKLIRMWNGWRTNKNWKKTAPVQGGIPKAV